MVFRCSIEHRQKVSATHWSSCRPVQLFRFPLVNPNLAHSKPFESVTDPLVFGGGFIPESQPSRSIVFHHHITMAVELLRRRRIRSLAIIYYASRVIFNTYNFLLQKWLSRI